MPEWTNLHQIDELDMFEVPPILKCHEDNLGEPQNLHKAWVRQGGGNLRAFEVFSYMTLFLASSITEFEKTCQTL